MNNKISFVAGRLKEASSWAGVVGMLLAAMHVTANPTIINASLGVLAAIGGLVAVLVPEQTSK